MLSLIFIQHPIVSFFLCIVLVSLNHPMRLFHSRLVTFSGFFSFSNAVKSGLKYDGSEESERMEDRLHNLYKLPFVLLPLVVLLADYMPLFYPYILLEPSCWVSC